MAHTTREGMLVKGRVLLLPLRQLCRRVFT